MWNELLTNCEDVEPTQWSVVGKRPSFNDADEPEGQSQPPHVECKLLPSMPDEIFAPNLSPTDASSSPKLALLAEQTTAFRVVILFRENSQRAFFILVAAAHRHGYWIN